MFIHIENAFKTNRGGCLKIETQNLSKWYGQIIGVNDLSFTIGPGVTGFLGPNGAGKTTLIKLLTGQLKPSQGEVTIQGEKVWNNHRLFKDIGYCPEQDAFWNYLTGYEFVYSMTRMHGFSKSKAGELSMHAIQQTGMKEGCHKKIGSFSKGMRQRIKLAQAIAHNPKMFLFDEPLNGLDPFGRRSVIDLIKKFGKQGKTVVVSSHILHEVEEMTETILLINHGRILAQGSIYEIRQLIDTHPLQISIRCSNVDVLTAKLLKFDDVLSIQFNRAQNQLTVETNRPVEFHQRLPKLIKQSGVTLDSLWSPDENLESVFDYLVR